MSKNYSLKNFLFISTAFLLFVIASCKKDSPKPPTPITPVTATPTQIGVYGIDTTAQGIVYRELLTAVSKIGTQSVNYDLVYDTGSGGMVIDAQGILPASMITANGFNFTGDSTVVNGITITSQKSTIEYGADSATTDKVYGNLAYAPVTVGDQNGNIVVKRLAFFLYYKATAPGGSQFAAHDFDVFGVNNEYDVTFANGVSITSPFSYFDPGTGLTKGFKMAVVSSNYYSVQGTYAPVISLGLTAADLSSSSGFVFSDLSFYATAGYPPIIPAKITYAGKSFSTQVLFDTGTDPYSYLEDPTLTSSTATLLPQNTAVSLAATSGFNYNYVITQSDNLTNVENPNKTGGGATIVSLEFFLNNEFLLDFANHRLGLKNN